MGNLVVMVYYYLWSFRNKAIGIFLYFFGCFLYFLMFSWMICRVSSDVLIDKIYQNILNRTTDDAGKNYWRVELNDGKVSKQNFIIAIVNAAKSATGGAEDRALLANKTSISKYFTVTNTLLKITPKQQFFSPQ